MKNKFDFLLRWGAFFLLVIPAVLRVCTLLSPNPSFAFDPLQLPMLTAGLGPSGALLLDTLSMLGCAAALWLEIRRGRGIDLRVMVLALLPLVAVGYHIFGDPAGVGTVFSIRQPENLFLGSAWVAAVLTAVGAFHLGRDRQLRVLLVGAVVGLVVPLAIKGIYQVFVEHPLTLQGFAETREAVYRAEGWAPDSVQARMYERRLQQAEASGWFGLSNVFGTYLACLTAFWMALTLAAARSRLSSGWIGLLGLLTLAAMAGLALTFSKGAIASGVVGVGLAVGVLLPRRYRKRIRPWTNHLAVGLIVLAVVGVILRGAVLGTQSAVDGYSLLFRWYYWLGGWEAFWQSPIFGVGPEGFKAAYVIFKPVLSPEEVRSPHNIFVSYFSTLGLFGVAWSALLLLLLKRSAPVGLLLQPENPTEIPTTENQFPHSTWWSAVVPALVVSFVSLGAGWWFNRNSFYPDFAILFWPLAVLGYAGVICSLPWIGEHSSWLLLRWSVWSAITVLLVHCQIEMTLTRPGAAAALFLLLGAGALSPQIQPGFKPRRRRRIGEYAVLLSVIICLLIQFLGGYRPTAQHQKLLHAAAVQLSAVGQARADLQVILNTQEPAELQRLISALAERLKGQSADPRIDGRLREFRHALQTNDRARVQQLQRLIMAELQFAIKRLELLRIGGSDGAGRGALALLGDARAVLPYDPIAAEESAKLWLIIARAHHEAGDVEAREQAFAEGTQLLTEMLRRRPELARLAASASLLHHEHFQRNAEPAELDRALEMIQRAGALDPQNLQLTLRQAELLQLVGDSAAAAVQYRKALIINENLRLDPLKQLPPKKRREIEAYLQMPKG